MSIKIWYNKHTSKTGKALKEALNAIKLRGHGPPVRGSNILIWGSKSGFNREVNGGYTIFNRSYSKLEQYKVFRENDIPHPPWTESIQGAQYWLAEGKTVFARTLLNAHSGKGIVIFTGDEVAPVYTQYIKKAKEYRVHVFQGKIIDIQEKRGKVGAEKNTQIRNLANGYVYCRENVNLPDAAMELALRATAALNLLWGAVDLIYNQRQNCYYVLEVNSAPGLTGTTLNNYVKEIKNAFRG